MALTDREKIALHHLKDTHQKRSGDGTVPTADAATMWDICPDTVIHRSSQLRGTLTIHLPVQPGEKDTLCDSRNHLNSNQRLEWRTADASTIRDRDNHRWCRWCALCVRKGDHDY